MPLPGFCGADGAARRALARDIRSHASIVAGLKTALFARHVELNVRYATPLLDIVSCSEGLDLSGAVGLIKPPRSWPTIALSNDSRQTSRGCEHDFTFNPKQILSRHRYAGIVVRRDAASSDITGVRLVGSSVELTVVRGCLRLDTFHGLGRLLVDGPVPDTIATAMVGRPVSQLVDHPWLTHPDWKVMFVATRRCGRTTVIFETGQLPWRLRPMPVAHHQRELIAC